jgi:small-conductance mechanosensitive channel
MSASTADAVRAGVYLAVTLVVAWLVDRFMASHGGELGRSLTKKLDTSAKTRLRLARRLVVAAIIFIGAAFALFQLPQVGGLARAMLASAAFTAVVVGLAARSALANPLAGIVIAITQPVRLGDYVTIADVSGTVEEIGLVYTYIRTADNRRVVIPNEELASTVVHNYTIVDEASAAGVDFVVPTAAALADVIGSALDEARRFHDDTLGREPAVAVTDLTADSVCLRATIWAKDKPTADRTAAELRVALAARLTDEGLLASASDE